MQISTLGMIDVLGHEGLCLSPYLDSVGVWTIGAGITSSDGVRINAATPSMTLEKVMSDFILKIKPYSDEVAALKMDFSQVQHDALTSACYNFGDGNLQTLCRHRTIKQIGDALMLYRKPPEITARRRDEQRLYQTGVYSNHDHTTLLFPVTASHHPDYHHGKLINVLPYFPAQVAA